MKTLIITLVVFSCITGWVTANDIAILRMSPEQRNQLFQYLETTACNCGCGMTIGHCLRDDPTCPVSPELAKQAINALLQGGNTTSNSSDNSADQSSSRRPEINSSQNGSVVSGQVDGQDCTYASVGGTTVRMCD